VCDAPLFHVRCNRPRISTTDHPSGSVLRVCRRHAVLAGRIPRDRIERGPVSDRHSEAILEKVLYVGTMIAMYLQGQLQAVQAAAIVVPDGLLALFFVASFFKTPPPLARRDGLL
jgi:hypothetical protein